MFRHPFDAQKDDKEKDTRKQSSADPQIAPSKISGVSKCAREARERDGGDELSGDVDVAPFVPRRGWSEARGQPGSYDEAEMVRMLEATGRYQILKKLEPRAIAPALRPGYPLRGVILDTETVSTRGRTRSLKSA
ncbi:hypothetical protein FBZ99_10753 [Rhizobium sp. ERR 1071]|nr:hypothetical protein FBZ99_10753 [Rhizobium sp. ERR1071]